MVLQECGPRLVALALSFAVLCATPAAGNAPWLLQASAMPAPGPPAAAPMNKDAGAAVGSPTSGPNGIGLHYDDPERSRARQAENIACSAEQLERNPAFETLPWNITVLRALAFMVNSQSSLPPAPTYPPAWAGRPEWKYNGGFGLIAALQYEDTPVGPYSELMYTVGVFEPGCKAAAPNSIMRIWVDSSATCDAGHRIWGIPKQMALFQWHETNNTLGVTVTHAGSGEVVFNATAKDTPIKAEMLIAAMSVGTSMQLVHWPINANKQRRVAAGTVPVYGIAAGAFAEGKAITTTINADYTGSIVNTAGSVFINHEAFTGRQEQQPPLQVQSAGVSIKSGDTKSVWSISKPSVC